MSVFSIVSSSVVFFDAKDVAYIPLGSSRYDTYGVSHASWWAFLAVLSDSRDTALRDFCCVKMHGLDSVSCRDVTSQVEFGLIRAGLAAGGGVASRIYW